MTHADDLAAKRKRRNEWLKWKVRTQAKQIAALSDKLKTHQSAVRQAIKDYQAGCDETAATYAEDETETGRQLYWRADGASDAMDALLILVMSPPQKNDLAPLVDAAVHILTYPPPPLPMLPPGMPHNPGIPMVEPILYPEPQENDK